MLVEKVEAVLRSSDTHAKLFQEVVGLAVKQAGSIKKVAKATGLRRQSIALWLRGGIVPAPESVRTVLRWLKESK